MIPKEQHNEVATNMQPIAKSLAHQFSQKHHSIDYDSALSAANLGLVKALESFDASAGVRFRTYAAHRMKGQILDDIRRNSHHPRLVLDRHKRGEAVADKFYKERGQPMTPEQRAKKLGGSVGSDDAAFVSFVSFGTPAVKVSESRKALTLENAINDGSLPIGSEQSAMDTLRAITRDMPRRDVLVFKLYFIEQMTMLDIAKTIGVSESRVSQIVTRSLPTLRDRYKELFAEAA